MARAPLALMAAFAFVLSVSCAHAGTVTFKDDQLFIDGKTQPQLYGAEVQYFRLRGGSERNVPRARVLEIWNKTLDRFVEAKMNTISFYIPWDFHEYAPGKFDFDGTVDEDGDGQPDFPSRDVRTWFKLIEARGIKHIMVRPGPYINAEWGFLGFGAVPEWFNDKYPDSHAHNARGQRTLVYSYQDPDFLRESKRWLTTVYRDVIAPYVGPGRPVSFVQLDNETNFQWSSLYNHDYGPRSLSAYRSFLIARYGSLDAINRAHGRRWTRIEEVMPPLAPMVNISEDQDWYRYEDEMIHTYLGEIRKIWEGLGVREPQVLFTLAESYNASDNGLLPHYQLRNDPGRTGMMTVNLYPKTYDNGDHTLMNNAFKADHDVKAADAANDFYLGKKVEWALGPEIQGGWWRGTEVTLASRQQTYLTTIGHGLKGMFVYYFNEGQNWDYDWAKKKISPLYETLRADSRFKDTAEDALPDTFWGELENIVSDKLFFGWNPRWLMGNGGTQPRELYFDAAVSGEGEARAPFTLLKEIGEKIVAPYGAFLGRAVEATDPVCMIKDSASHVPSKVPGLNSLRVNSEWAAGLLALLMQSGVNPKILHWGLTPESEYDSCRLFVYQDNGFATASFTRLMRKHLARGAGFLSFLHDGAFRSLREGRCTALSNQPIELNGEVCRAEGRGPLYLVRQPIYDGFNNDLYARLGDVVARRALVDGILHELGIVPVLRFNGGADRIVAFGRKNGNAIYVTVKNGQILPVSSRIQWSEAAADQTYVVTRSLAGTRMTYSGRELIDHGFSAVMEANGSDAFYIAPTSETSAH